MNAPAKEEKSWFGFQMTKEGLYTRITTIKGQSESAKPLRFATSSEPTAKMSI